MRSIIDMDTVQIEITNACVKTCSNCTRFCGHHRHPFFMPFDEVKRAIDSMVGYPKMTGIMGGEPLLHPDFKKICEYALSKIPHEQLGLWTSFPKGYEKHREIVCKTFYNIFLNDHTIKQVYHHPPLVAINEVVPNENEMWQLIDHCWAQRDWSASINPRGAWFCEMAASLSMLFEEGKGWPVEPGWWWRIPIDFKEQAEQFCPRCGMAAPIERTASIGLIDDISPNNLSVLINKSPKIEKGRYRVHDLKRYASMREVEERWPRAAYKDFYYRQRIADRYGIFLLVNEKEFMTPYLKKNFNEIKPQKPLLEVYREKYA